MAADNLSLKEYVEADIKKYKGIMVPVKAGLAERLLVHEVSWRKLHPNPEDVFCDPSIGPKRDIIDKYASQYRRQGDSPITLEEPIMVEKVSPDGYRILNGHHRWAAAMRTGRKKVRIQIVNIAQEADVREMIGASRHEKRAAMDLDEVVFAGENTDSLQKALPFPHNLIYKERIRLGIPALFRFLSDHGYDIWIYTAGYHSYDYILKLFEKYNIRITGIITGTERYAHRRTSSENNMEKLIGNRYAETLHIDQEMIVRTFSRSAQYQEYRIETDASGWSAEVISALEGLLKDEKTK